jgi:hypothetical protein
MPLLGNRKVITEDEEKMGSVFDHDFIEQNLASMILKALGATTWTLSKVLASTW